MNDEKENGKNSNSNSNHALAFQKENYSFIVQLWSLWIIVFIHFYRFSINLISFDLILYACSVFFRFLLKNLNTHIFCTTWIINTVLLVGWLAHFLSACTRTRTRIAFHRSPPFINFNRLNTFLIVHAFVMIIQ